MGQTIKAKAPKRRVTISIKGVDEYIFIRMAGVYDSRTVLSREKEQKKTMGRGGGGGGGF